MSKYALHGWNLKTTPDYWVLLTLAYVFINHLLDLICP